MLPSEYVGIKRYLCTQKKAFRFLCIDITSDERTLRNPRQMWLHFGITITFISTMAHYSWKNRSELGKATVALAPLLEIMLALVKFLVFVYKNREMRRLVRHLQQSLQKASASERAILDAENTRESYFSTGYYASVVFTAAVAFVVPQIKSALIYSRTGVVEFFVPFIGSYPLDQNQPWAYFLIVVHNFIGVSFAVHASVSVDTLFIWFVHNVVAQFRIVGLQLKCAGSMGPVADVVLEKSIQRCIQQHQLALRRAAELRDVFSPIIFVEFLLSCLQMCFIAYQLTRRVDMENLIFMGLFSCVVSFQLMMYCYGGQRVQNASERIANDIYASFPWHRLGLRAKRLLLLPIKRAQKPACLTGIFFVADLSLYLWVFRNAASYVALLRSIDDQHMDNF